LYYGGWGDDRAREADDVHGEPGFPDGSRTGTAETGEPRRLVRPYTRTGGRTHSGQHRLELETLLSTSVARDGEAASLRTDLRAICHLCRTPHSTAEVSAHLGLPLGAARVLIADVVDLGLLHVHQTVAGTPTMDLLHRIAAGLKSL
jgi:hypothetical protein